MSACNTWLDRAKTPPPRKTTTSIEIPRRSRLNRDQLIIFLLSLFTFSSKLSAADARTQHQPPPVITPRGKTTESRNRTREGELSHFPPLLPLPPSSLPSNGSYSTTIPRCPPRFLESSSRDHLSRLSILLSIFVPMSTFFPQWIP